MTFSDSLLELERYEIPDLKKDSPAYHSDSNFNPVSRVTGLVGGKMRRVEVLSGAFGFLLKVAGGGEVCISPDGDSIIRLDVTSEPTALEVEIILGPALVFALALRGVWCLHASAAVFGECLMVFLGESGQGKSTLASHLARQGSGQWRLVADDILPVAVDSSLLAFPHFPQLKVLSDSQPGHSLPGQMQVGRICLLKDPQGEQGPGLQLLKRSQAVRVLAAHTAGARLFDQRLLANHLAFVSRAVQAVPVYELVYPRRQAALAEVKRILETAC